MRFIFRDISVTATTTHSTTRPGLYHHSHMSLSQWFFFIWMYCIVSPVSGISVKEISKKMGGGRGGGLQYKTCYYMARKAMQKITDSEKDKMLSGNCEVDELYMQWTERKELSQYHHIIKKTAKKTCSKTTTIWTWQV